MWQKFQDTAVISNNIHIFAKWKRSRKARFIEETNTRKAMHITMVTTYGVRHNEYFNDIQSKSHWMTYLPKYYFYIFQGYVRRDI